MVVHLEVMIRNKTIGKMNTSAAAGYRFRGSVGCNSSTKPVKGLHDIEYEERAQLLHLDSLSCRMDKGDMILVYKILNGFLEGVQWQD